MDTFGKYMAQRAAAQAQAAQRIAREQFEKRAAAQRAAQAATRTASSGAAAFTGGNMGAGSLGNFAARAAASAAPAVTSPAPPPPPTIGQVIAANIVDRAQAQAQTARQQFGEIAGRSYTPTTTPAFQTEAPEQAPEPWQIWQAPDGRRVVMPESYTPPEDWTTFGDPVTDAPSIENARTSPLAYDNQPDEVKNLIALPQNETETGRTPFDFSGIGQQVGQRSEQQATRAVRDALQLRAEQSAGDLGAISSEAEAERRRDQSSAGLTTGDTPYVRVRSARTGEVYTIDRSRLDRLGPDDEVLGPATTQPEESQDRGAAGTDIDWGAIMRGEGGAFPASIAGGTLPVDLPSPGEFIDTAKIIATDAATQGIVWIDGEARDAATGAIVESRKIPVIRDAQDMIGDIWTMVQVGLNDPSLIPGSGVVTDFIETAREDGIFPAIGNLIGGPYLDWIDTGRVINTNNAIDLYIRMRTGAYEPGEMNILSDATGLTTGLITTGAQGSIPDLENVVIPTDRERGIMTAGNVTFPEWYESTSTVIYEDGTIATVYNADIENNPEAFEGATIYANEERANAAYNDGIDLDGDGNPDKSGADAVRILYEEDISGLNSFVWQVGMDPLTYVPLTTAAGGRIRNIGAAKIAAAPTRVDKLIGQGVKTIGTVIQRGSQAIDEATSFGAGIIFDRLTRGTGWAADKIWLGRETNLSRQQTQTGDAASAGVGIAARARNDATAAMPETLAPEPVPDLAQPSVTTPRVQTQTRPQEPELDPRTPDGAPQASRPTENLDPGPELRTPDGGTVSTRVADGEGGTITREVSSTGGIRAVSRDSQYPPRTLRTANGDVDVSGVNGARYDRIIEESGRANPPAVVQAAVDSMRAGGRFIDNEVLQRSIGNVYNTRSGTVDNMLVTSTLHREWNEALVNAGGTPIAYQRSVGQTNIMAEAILDLPWDATTAHRAQLRNLPASNPNAAKPYIPRNATPDDLAAAERYVDLVDEHLRRHPEAIRSPRFQESLERANRLRQQLSDMEYPGREAGAMRRGNLIGGGRAGAGDAVVDDEITPLTGQGDSGYANAAQTRRVVLPGEHEFGDIGGYPVVNEMRVGANNDLMREVRLDEDTTVQVRPIRQASVDQSIRRQYPDVDQPTWAQADIIDESIEPGTARHIAPDEEEAVRLAAEDARARGLIADEAPAPETPDTPTVDADTGEIIETTARQVDDATTPMQPSDASTGEARPVIREGDQPPPTANDIEWQVTGEGDRAVHASIRMPDGSRYLVSRARTQNVPAQIRADEPGVDEWWRGAREDSNGTITHRQYASTPEEARELIVDAAPPNMMADLPDIYRNTVSDGTFADAATARNFHQAVAVPMQMTPEDVSYVLRALRDIRAAGGSAEPLQGVIDLVHPDTKILINQAMEIASTERAIRVHRGILNNEATSRAAKRASRAKVTELDAKLKRLRKESGWTDPEVRSPQVRQPLDTERAAQRRLERVTTATKEQDTYIGNLRKMTSLEYTDAPANGITMDRHGMVRFEGALLTPDEVATLTRHTFDGGDTFLDRWNRNLTEVRGGGQPSALRQADDIQVSLDMTLREYEDLMKAMFPVREANKFTKAIRAITQYMREKILGSWLSAPRYFLTQYLGNPFLMGLGGYGDPRTLATMSRGITRSYKEMRSMRNFLGADVLDTGEQLMQADRLAMRWGTGNAPEVRRHVSSETDVFVEHGVVEGWFKRHGMSPIGTALRPITGDVRVIQWGAAVDMAARDAIYGAAFNRTIRQRVPEFRIQVNDELMNAGMSRRQAVEITGEFSRRHPSGFSSNDVREFYRQYLPDGKAERLGRDWQSMVNATNKHARSEVKRVLFAGKTTNADQILSNVLLFHYFMSRQYVYLVRQALHHPGLINTYVRFNEMMEEYAEDTNAPSWLRGFLRFTLSGPGIALYFHPMNLLSVGNIFGDAPFDFGSEDDQTWVERVLDKTDDWVFFHPLIVDGLNLFGYTGEWRNLDPLRITREVGVFNTIMGWGAHRGWWDGEVFRGNWFQDQLHQGREFLSGILPGSEQIEYVESVNREQREFQQVIEDLAAEAGITDSAEIEAIYMDPTHPIYKEAERRYLWNETANIAVKFLPFRGQSRLINFEGDDLLSNTTAEQRRRGNVTDKRARGLRNQSQGYYAIGDNRVYEVADTVYNDIAYADEVWFDVEVDGITYTHDQIQQMSDEERRDLAVAWLAETGLYYTWQETKDQRDEYLSRPENAEFATFKRWQAEVYQYDGGVDAYWQAVIADNPNAREFYEGLDEKLPPHKREQALAGMYGYMAVAGIPTDWRQVSGFEEGGQERDTFRGTPYGRERSRPGDWYTTSDYRAPAPKDTNNFDPLGIANQPPTPTEYVPYESEYNKDLRRELDNYNKYRAEDEVVLQQIYADWGLPPDTARGSVPYKTKKAIDKEFKNRTGREVTYASGKVRDYFLWVDENPGGTLDEYIRWKDYNYVQNLPESFTKEQQRTPEGADRDMESYEFYDKDLYRGD